MPHNDDGLLDTLVRALGMTNDVQQSALFATCQAMKELAPFLVLPKEFPQLLGQRQTVFAAVFSQHHVDLRPKIQSELFSKPRVYRDDRQTSAIAQDGALVFLFTIQRTNNPTGFFVYEFFLDINRDAEMRSPELVVRALEDGSKAIILFRCFL